MSSITERNPQTDETVALERARTVGFLLDESIRIPVIGYRIGIDPILGILPLSGDFVAALGSLYIVLQGIRIGLPRREIATMIGLVGVEFALGSIPVIGTLLDAVWKVNERNVGVLEAHVEERS